MKLLLQFKVLFLSALALALVTPVVAKSPGEHESRMLMHLLSMDDAELAKVRETIERIENMSPEERATLRNRLKKLQDLTPEKRKAIKERYESIPKEEREAMRQKWFNMTPEERREWRMKLRQMSPEERIEALKDEGFMPPPPPRDRLDSVRQQMEPMRERKGPPPPLR